jgi:hypothetical protein
MWFGTKNPAKSFWFSSGSCVWGDYAMAAQSHLKKDQIEKMVKWVLSLKLGGI